MVGVTGSIPVAPTILRSRSERRMSRRARGEHRRAQADAFPRSLNGESEDGWSDDAGISSQRNSQTELANDCRRRDVRSRCLSAGRRRARPTGRCASRASPTTSATTAASIRARCLATPFGSSTTMAGRTPTSCASRATTMRSSVRPTRNFRRQLHALFDAGGAAERIELFNIICVPGLADASDNPGDATACARAPCVLDRRLRRDRHAWRRSSTPSPGRAGRMRRTRRCTFPG